MPQEYYLELLEAKASPSESPFHSGIQVRDGLTTPFVVERHWSGPAGHYVEQWSIRRGLKSVIYTHPPQTIFVRGLQSVTTTRERVDEQIALEPGAYKLVFVVEGRFMGVVDLDVKAVDTAAA